MHALPAMKQVTCQHLRDHPLLLLARVHVALDANDKLCTLQQRRSAIHWMPMLAVSLQGAISFGQSTFSLSALLLLQ